MNCTVLLPGSTIAISASRALFLLFDEVQKARLFANIAESMQGVPANIAERQIELFRQIHPKLDEGVCAARAGSAILIKL